MWFFYAFGFAFLGSIGTLIAKKILKSMDEYSFIVFGNLFAIIPLFLIILFFYQLPKIDNTFILAMIGSVSLDFFAILLAYRAIKISEISLISPISAFNPVFTSIVSFFTLREMLDHRSIVGIVLIVFGSYLLQIKHIKEGLLTPIKKLFEHKGVQMAFGANLLFSITPTFQKIAIQHTFPQVPPFVSLVGLFSMMILYSFVVKKKSKKVIKSIKINIKLLLVGGLLASIAQAFAYIAFSKGNLGPVTAVFKFSMIFVVLWGWIFFKEKNIKERLLGSTVMLIGVALLVL